MANFKNMMNGGRESLQIRVCACAWRVGGSVRSDCWKAINIVSLLVSTLTFLWIHMYVGKCGVIMFQVEDKKEKLQEAQRFHFDAM